MATVSHFVPSSKTSLICPKGNLHEQQALNLVCLDPLCRSSPLSCCVCFTETHKYHKVVGLNKFIDDYSRNIGKCNSAMLQDKISTHYRSLKLKISEMKLNLVRRLEEFERAVDKYAEYLSGHSIIRQCVSQQLNIELEPEKISMIKSRNQLESSLRFILNNCLIDQNLNMVNASQILKQNQERVIALLDKVVYMTDFCDRSLDHSINLLSFANETIKEEKNAVSIKIKTLMSASSGPVSIKNFVQQKDKLKKLIDQTSSLVLEQSQKVGQLGTRTDFPKVEPEFIFGRHKSNAIEIYNKGKTIKSTLHNQKPQYALAWPSINLEPTKIKEWSFEIRKCRNFASQNTIAVGISKLSDMRLVDFNDSPSNCLMISSQGYVSLNRKIQKTNFTYQEGDVVNLKYDPFYQTLEVSKQNGRKLILKTFQFDEPVYPCVRMTYAPDEISII